MAGLDGALRVLWDERHPERPDWLPNLLLKHVTRIIMTGVVARSADTAAMRSGLGPADRERLRTVLDGGGWAEVRAQCVAADAYLVVAWDHFRELPRERRPTANREAVSEKACTDVRAVHGRLTRETADGWVTAAVTAARERYQRVEVARAPLVRRLIDDDDAFVARFRDRFDASWRGRDVAAHEADPPWRLGLGSLARPPLGRACLPERLAADRIDWRLGTDRPVYSRYRHYISKRGAGRLESTAGALGVSSDRHMWARLTEHAPDAPAHAELDRAAEPLGLRFAAHRTLLDMLRHGVLLGDVEVSRRGPKKTVAARRSVLDRWCAAHHELPTAADDGLIDALGHGCASAAVRYSSVTTLAEARGGREDRTAALSADAASDRPAEARSEAEWTGQVELGVLRRMWQECLHCEMEWDTALTPATLPRLVGGVFGAHLVELAARPITRPEPPAAPVARDAQTRLADTVRVLGPVLQDLARAAHDDADGWRDLYAAALERADPTAPPGHYLDADEFRRVVGRLWAEHDRGEPDDPDGTDDGTDDDEGGS